MQCYLNIAKAAGVQAAIHGGFKSEQEVMRNLIRHQAAFYCIDELGLVLNKLANAGKKAGHRILRCGGCANERHLKSKRLSAHNGRFERRIKSKTYRRVRTD